MAINTTLRPTHLHPIDVEFEIISVELILWVEYSSGSVNSCDHLVVVHLVHQVVPAMPVGRHLCNIPNSDLFLAQKVVDALQNGKWVVVRPSDVRCAMVNTYLARMST